MTKQEEKIISEIEPRTKAAHQKLLEEIENKYPERAAELDTRKPGDII